MIFGVFMRMTLIYLCPSMGSVSQLTHELAQAFQTLDRTIEPRNGGKNKGARAPVNLNTAVKLLSKPQSLTSLCGGPTLANYFVMLDVPP